MERAFHSESSGTRSIQLIAFLGFLFGLSISLLAYVMSSYFKEVTQSDNVSVFYLISFVVFLPFLFNLHRFIEGFGRARTLMTILMIQVEILFFLQFAGVSLWGAVLLIGYSILNSIVAVVIDVVLEAYTVNGTTGRLRGLYLSVWNLGILVGPMISMYVLQQYGFDMIFTIELIVYAVMFLAVFVALNNIQGHVKRQNFSFITTVNAFRKNHDLLKIYCVSLALRFFYAGMTIYMPLYLYEIGLGYMEIGAIFTVMLIPFILIEYPAGILADTKYGEKEMLLLGVVIMIISLVVMFFVRDANFIVWMGILVVSRIGAALVESMEDSYFYKQINENDVALINFFRSTRAVAYIFCAVSAGFALVFFDIRSIFVVMACAMVLAIYPILRLRDTR